MKHFNISFYKNQSCLEKKKLRRSNNTAKVITQGQNIKCLKLLLETKHRPKSTGLNNLLANHCYRPMRTFQPRGKSEQINTKNTKCQMKLYEPKSGMAEPSPVMLTTRWKLNFIHCSRYINRRLSSSRLRNVTDNYMMRQDKTNYNGTLCYKYYVLQ